MTKFICKYCQKECKNANSLRNHERLCKDNPNRQFTAFQLNNPQKIHAWNAGLTTQSDQRMYNLGQAVSKALKGKPGHVVSEETKAKISATMKEKGYGGLRSKSGRGKKGYYKGYYCDSTYELVYIIYNLDHNIEFMRCPTSIHYLYKYNNETRRYYPDFMLSDGSLIEIKGYVTDQVLAKIAAVKDRKITVLYRADLQYAFDYVKNNYSYKNLTDLYE